MRVLSNLEFEFRTCFEFRLSIFEFSHPSQEIPCLVFRPKVNYYCSVKSCLPARRGCGVFVLGLLLLFSASAAPTKIIRLRNQPIPPKAAKNLEPSQANSLTANASGLFLI